MQFIFINLCDEEAKFQLAFYYSTRSTNVDAKSNFVRYSSKKVDSYQITSSLFVTCLLSFIIRRITKIFLIKMFKDD